MPDGLVSILGGGPAGASAAIAARQAGSPVRVIEKSRFPRHKVCGEFFSPEIAPELERLAAWDAFQNQAPAIVRRIKLHFGRRENVSRLAEPAWGLSRSAFDALLLDHARAAGAEVVAESNGETPMVLAAGRRVLNDGREGRGRRLFGFKAHFEGPVDDAVELFFFDRCYVGLNSIEGGRTNVCGLGPEDFLRGFDFDFDRVVRQCPALADRLRPLERSIKWLSTGPLRYDQKFDSRAQQYLAGDALSFVDPFTGSGILAAVKTGELAGIAASRREPVADYLSRCRASLRKPFEISSLCRVAIERGWADWIAPFVPARALFALTRPHR